MRTEKELMIHEDMVEQFQNEYESIVAEDKALDKDFRKGFADLPNHVINQLYKLFKRRPRAQRLRAQAENTSNMFGSHPLSGSQAPDGLSQMLTAMEELDAPENMPEELNLIIWERFCFVRKTKVESEQRMKMKALNLAEMQAFQQRRRDEDNSAQEEIKQVFEELLSLQNKRNRHLMNTPVQMVLKQEQVETSTADWTDNTAEADFIVFHRSVVDNLKKNIRTRAEQKVASMEARREVCKDIIQLEWEHRVMNKKTEDLYDKKKDIKMLRLSKDQQDMKYCSKKEQNTLMLANISRLEKSIDFMKKTHQKSIEQRMKKLKRINNKTVKTAESSAALDKEIPEMQVAVAELQHIYEATATEKKEAAEREERYQEIVQRRKLEDLARVQSEHLEILWGEHERLQRRNFPSLDQLKHTS